MCLFKQLNLIFFDLLPDLELNFPFVSVQMKLNCKITDYRVLRPKWATKHVSNDLIESLVLVTFL